MKTQRSDHSPFLPIATLSPRLHLPILITVTLVILFSGSWKLPLVDRDEPRFAQATREMIAKNDYLVPYFNGEYRFDKPPFIYWNMAIFYGLFGVEELSARLPTILHALLLVLVTYLLGRTFFPSGVAFAGAFGLATCLQFQIHGRLAVADLPMIFYLTAAQGLLMMILLQKEEKHPWLLLTLFYSTQVLGFLAKGPVVQLITVLTLVLFRLIFWRQPVPWQRLKPHLGIPFMIASLGIWGIPALIQTHGLWWKVGIGNHVIDRGLETFNGRRYFAPYYLITSVFSLCPWFALVGYGYLAVRQHWQAPHAFLCAWIFSTYLIFTFYATQLPHYVMPAYPAIFLLLGQITTLSEAIPPWAKIFGWIIEALYFLLAVILGEILLRMPSGNLQWVVGGVFCLLCGLILLLRSFSQAWRSALLAAILLIAAGWNLVGYNLRPLSPALAIESLAASLPPESQFLAGGFSEPSLVFYTNRHWQLDQSSQTILQTLQEKTGPGMVVNLDRELSLWPSLVGLFFPSAHRFNPPSAVPLLPEADPSWHQKAVSGLNLARASWVELTVYYREQ